MAPRKRPPRGPNPPPTTVRVVGGRFRGSKLQYHGDPVTRPMKDRTREAVFNLLGPRVKDGYAIDLFAGTGALAIEAISRGAVGATLCERHFPTAKLIDENLRALEIESLCQVHRGDTFHFSRDPQLPVASETHWLIFCSPPYELYVSHAEPMRELLDTWIGLAPAGSMFAVESDHRFDPQSLPQSASWDVRTYPPAQVAILDLEAN